MSVGVGFGHGVGAGIPGFEGGSVWRDYACILHQVNLANSQNTFFVLQLVQVGDTIVYHARWGRVGSVGQMRQIPHPPGYHGAAIKRFQAKFKGKTGHVAP